MIATLTARGPRMARPAKARAARPARPARPRHHPTVSRSSWEIRSFSVAAATIVGVFALALLYLTQMTALSAGGYEMQRLQAERDELRRQNALLEVQMARLDSPSRIEVQAKRLGLVHLARVPVLVPEPLQARR